MNILINLIIPKVLMPFLAVCVILLSVCIWGNSGVGKTTTTIKLMEELELPYYIKPSGVKWWDGYVEDGYVDQAVAIINEFTSCFSLSTFLQLTDMRPPHLEIKGSFIPNQIHLIWIQTINIHKLKNTNTING